MKNDVPTLSDILERIERIEGSGVDKSRFLRYAWDQDAMVRNLEVIGEAVKRLSRSTKERSPGLAWSKMAGFREVAIHGYDRLNLDRIWVLVEKELPKLKAAVRRLLSESGRPAEKLGERGKVSP